MSALARSVRAAPSLRDAIQSLRRSPWGMLAVVLAAGLTLDATLPSYVSAAVVNPMGGVIGVAAVGGLKRSRHPGAFNLLAVGVVTYSIADVVGLLAASRGMEFFAFGLFLVAYIAMATGLASFFSRRWRHNQIRRRHRREG